MYLAFMGGEDTLDKALRASRCFNLVLGQEESGVEP